MQFPLFSITLSFLLVGSAFADDNSRTLYDLREKTNDEERAESCSIDPEEVRCQQKIETGKILLVQTNQPAPSQAVPSTSENEELDTYSEIFSSNPGSTNAVAGTGALGRALGIKKDSGIQLGGVYVADIDYLISGGLNPKSTTGISSLILGIYFDVEKFNWWKGGLFGASFLRVDSGNPNKEAGSVQIYDNLSGIPPRHRSEFYEYWYRQELFDKKLVFRIGKMVTSGDFNNMLRERPIVDEVRSVFATSSLLYLPVYVTPTMIGVLPGYYNTAFGIMASYNPIDAFYISAGFNDGNLARFKNTGLHSPKFNGYYFSVGEAGYGWFLGKDKKPGAFSVGGWYQSGKFITNGIVQHGFGGIYCFGSQRLWYAHQHKDNSGILAFLQGGYNNSQSLPMRASAGGGLTFFGLVPRRPVDSIGMGASWSLLNRNLFTRASEFMLQAYYKFHMYGASDFIATFTSIPTPGAASGLPPAYIATGQVVFVF